MDAGDVRGKAAWVRDRVSALRAEIGRAIVGHAEIVDGVLTCLACGGHALLEGVPGLGKTTLIKSLGRVLDLPTSRIQFTPDLMPADIIGTNVLVQEAEAGGGGRLVRFQRGPVFACIVLADEINRATPKTQSALLEAMQEQAVTVGGTTWPLEAPFIVLATQNPIEMEGTYPLPEAQLDRFLFNVMLDYLSESEEMQVIDLTTTTHVPDVKAVTNANEINDFHQLVRMVPIAESVARYAVNIMRHTRPTEENAPDFVKKYVNFGASVRAAQFLVLASKARALMKGRYHVTYEDIRALALPILRHRILLNFYAESDRVKSDDILRRLLEWMPAPRGE